ncbi:hypothetical protein [Schaalia sp. ZJ1691]|uniref:hypothetical protein n=1 Tax=Schaalia sp. ZJ1691 TaxID=2709404 RepID=UPI0013EDAA08|nr:hypothetical protein [Schaalia sp. ZJ1691]
MKIRYLPAISSLVLVAIFAVLWFYALHTTSGAPTWARWLIALLIFCVSLMGIGAALKTGSGLAAKLAYVIGVLLVVFGAGSFYVLTALSTINVFGGLAILGGLVVALVASVIIAMRDRAEG